MATESPWTRGVIGSIADRLLGWQFGLPAETCNYKVQPLRIPIHKGTDRIELAADLYVPILLKDGKPAGTVLVQGPYGRGFVFAALVARIFAARGYQILFISSRGTFGSGGELDPFRTEVEDGKAVVEWMRKQPWYTGTFATLGASYLGFTQWALLMDPPSDMVAAIISVGPHDFQRSLWDTGSMSMDWIQWTGMILSQEESYHMLKMMCQPKRHRSVQEGIPLAQTVEAAYNGKADWLQIWMKNSDLGNDYYAPMKLDQSLENANIPILLISGWYDLFSDQTFEQYFRLRERGCNVALTVSKGSHNAVVTDGETISDTLAWLEEHLSHRKKVSRENPLRYYVTGAEEWRSAKEFPLAAKAYTLYLQGDGRLSTETPVGGNQSSSFVFDPRNPTPTMGGNKLGMDAGKVGDTALAERPDVMIFTTEPLLEDFEYVGRPTLTLSHATDSPFADLFVRISEVNEKGRSYNISEAYQRLNPQRKTESISMLLSRCAHRFVQGRRIRLIVAGGSHPHYARNLGVENPENTSSDMKSVEHTIFHGVGKESKLIFQ